MSKHSENIHDQPVSVINLKFQIFILYSVRIISDYADFHTSENVRIKSPILNPISILTSILGLRRQVGNHLFS